MVFVSYSQLDKIWLDRFLAASKPLERYAGIDLWSDRRIKSGEDWRIEINAGMDGAVVAVLLVSMNFLNSDFVATVELPHILAAARQRNLHVLWVRLTPCYFEATPLHRLHAIAGMPKPLNSMGEYGWMEALCKVCGEIDKIIKKFETPAINSGLNGRPVQRKEANLRVLAKPALRETEVLVHPGDGHWYTQSRVAKGSATADCWFGDAKHTRAGTPFRIIALTRGSEGRLPPKSRYPNLPEHRTRSQEVIVKRS
jgi:hypothetical protein